MSELSNELEGKITSDDKSDRIDVIKYGSTSMLEQLMADEDKEVAAMAKKVYDQSKVDVLDYEEKKDKAKLEYEKGEKAKCIRYCRYEYLNRCVHFNAYSICGVCHRCNRNNNYCSVINYFINRMCLSQRIEIYTTRSTLTL